MATFMVTGATGFIGSRFAELALAAGHQVRTLTRSDWSRGPAVPVNARFFGTFPNQIPAESLRGVDAVVHCAALLEADERAAFAVNVTGSVNLARMAQAAGARAFIMLSSQSALPDAVSVYGRSKYAVEQALQQVAGLDMIVIRPGLVCGPGSRGLFRRMCDMVEKLPIIPLLGGGQTLVQPIHVDDLCAAILTCAERSRELAGRILCLADPKGLTLAELLQRVAEARLGRRRKTLHVPLRPIELAVTAAEALRLPLPINSNNLKGLRMATRMDTAPDLARLGLTLRPVEAMVAKEPKPAGASPALPLDRRAVRVLLVGGGRIGLVHALNLGRRPGIDYVGTADNKPAALALLKGVGVTAPAYSSLETALREARPDAAVIATPPWTHLLLARACLGASVNVLIEKPLAVRAAELAEFAKLAKEFPSLAIQVGYLMPRNPQVESPVKRLRAGEFGRVRGFLGLTLHGYILQHDPKRWESKKNLAGGGALINSGCHVLSMIHAAFGPPAGVEAQSLKLHSTEVEDSMVARFRYDGFEGTHCVSWSIPGFTRQENRLVVWTDRGVLVLTAGPSVFWPRDGAPEVVHQLDFDVGFNLAPDYAGAGFSRELQDLQDSIRTGRAAPMDLAAALRIEEMMFGTYTAAQDTPSFRGELAALDKLEPVPLAATPATAASDATRPKRVLDLRELSQKAAGDFLAGASTHPSWDGFEVTSTQLAAGKWPRSLWRRLRVTVPDFLSQSRLLMSGRYADVLRQMGVMGVTQAGLAAMPLVLKARGVSFWAAAMGLLAGGLVHIPRGFDGTVLLHGYLADLALALRQTHLFDAMLKRVRRACPDARIGFHTNLAAEADAVLPLLETKLDELSLLASPNGLGLDAMFRSLRERSGQSPALTAEVGTGPALLHQFAARQPQLWTHGAETILVGPAAEPVLAEVLRTEKAQAWQQAFPGLTMPDAAL